LTNPFLLDDAFSGQASQTRDGCCYIGWRQGGKLSKGVDTDPVETALNTWTDAIDTLEIV